MKLEEIDRIRVYVEYPIKLHQLSRRSILELIRRYEDYYTNYPDEDMVDFNTFLNLYNNDDLYDSLHPDDHDILNASAFIVDIFEELLEEWDVFTPNVEYDENDDDVNKAKLYGEVYYDIEDAVRRIIGQLVNGTDNE